LATIFENLPLEFSLLASKSPSLAFDTVSRTGPSTCSCGQPRSPSYRSPPPTHSIFLVKVRSLDTSEQAKPVPDSVPFLSPLSKLCTQPAVAFLPFPPDKVHGLLFFPHHVFSISFFHRAPPSFKSFGADVRRTLAGAINFFERRPPPPRHVMPNSLWSSHLMGTLKRSIAGLYKIATSLLATYSLTSPRPKTAQASSSG